MEENNNPNPTLTEAAASQPVSSNQSMPSIRQLLEESWRLFTKKLFKIILIMLFVFLATFISFFIAGLVVIFTGLVLPEASGVSVQNLPSILSSSPLFLTVAGIAFVSAIVITVIVSLMSQASLILVLSEKDETVSAFRLFKKGWLYVLPLFIVGIIEFLITFGSIFLFIIPAIIVSIFLAFTTYVIVLENKRGMEAIKMSVGIVQQNFGAIVGRFILYFLLVIATTILLGTLDAASKEASVLVAIVRYIFNYAVNWFGIVFSFLVYQHARAIYNESKPVSLTWIWIVSGLGWIVAALILFVSVRGLGSLDPAGILRKQYEYNREQELDFDMDVPTGTEEEELYQLFDEETQEQLKQLQQQEDSQQI